MAAEALDGGGALTLSILVPVYNEVERAEAALDGLLATDLQVPFEVVVVDDGSTDGTRELLRRRGWPDNVRLVEHASNRGKGAAVRTALAHARGEFAAIFDADLEYEPGDLRALLEPLLAGRTNAVFGVRAFDGYTSHSYLFVLGNRLVTTAANVLYNVYLGDLMTCHKVVRTSVMRDLGLGCSGFTIEPEIAAKLLRRGERIFEIPVRYAARSSEEGKKLTIADGFRVLATLVRCRVAPRGGGSRG